MHGCREYSIWFSSFSVCVIKVDLKKKYGIRFGIKWKCAFHNEDGDRFLVKKHSLLHAKINLVGNTEKPWLFYFISHYILKLN